MTTAQTELVEEAVAIQRARRLAASGTARAIRESAGVSQQLVADIVGVDRPTVTRWELGIRRPSGPRAVAYAELLARLIEEQR